MQLRFIAREQLAPITATARNTDWFVAERQNKHGEKQFVRFVYSFLHYETRLPDNFMDYAVVRKFRVVRDQSCDSTMEIVSNYGLQFSKNEPPTLNRSAVLECYVATPADYRGAKRSR